MRGYKRKPCGPKGFERLGSKKGHGSLASDCSFFGQSFFGKVALEKCLSICYI
jgi:hypothetical protein